MLSCPLWIDIQKESFSASNITVLINTTIIQSHTKGDFLISKGKYFDVKAYYEKSIS